MCWCTISLLPEGWDLLMVFWLKNHLNTWNWSVGRLPNGNQASFFIWLSLAVAHCSVCMQPHWDNTSKRILLKTSARGSRAIVGVCQITLADCWHLITNRLELIQPGLISLGLFALLHLSKSKGSEASIIIILVEAIHDFLFESEKDELASPESSSRYPVLSKKWMY